MGFQSKKFNPSELGIATPSRIAGEVLHAAKAREPHRFVFSNADRTGGDDQRAVEAKIATRADPIGSTTLDDDRRKLPAAWRSGSGGYDEDGLGSKTAGGCSGVRKKGAGV
ncbi:hypothetical protein TIFTF001_033021 [Ficus carica]|uniref:Uncharacterized protein n=1 Tax=Ficus carica TaxID=3494 RepID=A0AA88J6K2_FICCA|nr:hypothetical protein TIFTF001_033021 [Ficus carica]